MILQCFLFNRFPRSSILKPKNVKGGLGPVSQGPSPLVTRRTNRFYDGLFGEVEVLIGLMLVLSESATECEKYLPPKKLPAMVG